jgi:hypothetical protein
VIGTAVEASMTLLSNSFIIALAVRAADQRRREAFQTVARSIVSSRGFAAIFLWRWSREWRSDGTLLALLRSRLQTVISFTFKDSKKSASLYLVLLLSSCFTSKLQSFASSRLSSTLTFGFASGEATLKHCKEVSDDRRRMEEENKGGSYESVRIIVTKERW